MRKVISQKAASLNHTLLRELNHRINNEFASAISAVSVAATLSANDEVKVALTAIAELLHRYADVHKALQMPAFDTDVDAAAYLRQLCNSLSRSKLQSRQIRVTLTSCPLWLESDQCWRLGMIVYELVTNAAKHAFSDAPAEIRVELSRRGELAECRVFDNGSASTD